MLFLLGCVALFIAARAVFAVCARIYKDPGPLLVIGGFIAFASTIYVTQIA